MIRVRKIARVAILALASLAVFLNVPAFSDFVLCLGGDGHFEVEYSVDGKCGASSAADHAADVSALHATDAVAHCGTCTDVSLMISMDGLGRPGQGITAGFGLFRRFAGGFHGSVGLLARRDGLARIAPAASAVGLPASGALAHHPAPRLEPSSPSSTVRARSASRFHNPRAFDIDSKHGEDSRCFPLCIPARAPCVLPGWSWLFGPRPSARTPTLQLPVLSTLAMPADAGGDSLTLEQALTRSLEQNPGLLAMHSEVRAREAGVLRADRGVNPELSLEAENFAGTGRYAGLEGLETTLGLRQVVELGGKRSLRKRAAEQDRQVGRKGVPGRPGRAGGAGTERLRRCPGGPGTVADPAKRARRASAGSGNRPAPASCRARRRPPRR